MRQDLAETVAIKAIAWLVGEDELVPTFLGASGATLADLRSGAEDPQVQSAVLDFVLMDDAWVLAFCRSAGLPFDAPARARAALPGGALPHWT